MFENPRRGRQARNFTQNAPKILDLKSSRSRYDFWPNCTPLSPNTIIYHGNVSLRILSFCIFYFLIPIYSMEKWPWQMARPMFNKDMTAYALEYTFFDSDLISDSAPSSRIRIFFKPSTFFLHESSFPPTQKSVNSLIYRGLSVWFTVRFKKYLDSNEAWIWNGCSRRIPDTLNPKKAFVLKRAKCVILNKY